MTLRGRATAVCVMENRAQAERAIEALRQAGFTDAQIGFAMRGANSERVAAGSAQGAATGAVAGAGIGGILGALAAGLIPGVGPVLAGGMLAGILGGAAAGAATGGMVGWLSGMGVPEHEARYYNQEFQAGRPIVSVRAEGRYQEAMAILSDYGTCSAPELGTMPQQGHERTARHATPADHNDVRPAAMPAAAVPTRSDMDLESTRIPVREEQVVARTREVMSGEVEVHKEVMEEQRHLSVPVEHDEVHIERRPVNQPSDLPVGADAGTIRVPLHEERVEVTKRPIIREEVEITRERVREERPITETVRREEVHVERHDWAEAMPGWRNRWQTRHGQRGHRWEDYEPGYRYGWEMAEDERWRGREWGSVESELQSDYGRWAQRRGYRHDDSIWERIKDSVREAWEGRPVAAGRRL